MNPLPRTSTVGYFPMEIALAPGIPTYNGGLGVLAADPQRMILEYDSQAYLRRAEPTLFTILGDGYGNRTQRGLARVGG